MKNIADLLLSKHIQTEDLFVKKYKQLCLKGQNIFEEDKKPIQYKKILGKSEVIKELENTCLLFYIPYPLNF